MPGNRYIEVILPVKLGWNPVYRVPESVCASDVTEGSRVKVMLQGKVLTGVVSRTGISSEGLKEERIRDILSLETGLEPVSREEIALWRFMSDYYLCTEGEVLKCAYPSGKIRSEEIALRARMRAEAAARRRQDEAAKKIQGRIFRLRERLEARDLALQGNHSEAVTARLTSERERIAKEMEDAYGMLDKAGDIPPAGNVEAYEPVHQEAAAGMPDCTMLKDALGSGKPVVLRSGAREDMYISLELRYLAEGRNVLHLVPEIAFTAELEGRMRSIFGDSLMVYHSHESEAQRREVAGHIRNSGGKDGRHYVILATRSAVFLPLKDLGLVIVDEEQDKSYKQDSPAPRYNARDTAVMIARIHGAAILLGSLTPSLETIYNCLAGRYVDWEGADAPGAEVMVIDTAAEKKKRGMVGQFSRKLLDAIGKTAGRGGQVILLRSWGDTAETSDEVRRLFPDVPDGVISVSTIAQTKRAEIPDGSLVALLQADTLLGAPDFRADERAMQVLERYRAKCRSGLFIIQTSRSSHELLKDDKGQGMASRYNWLLAERQNFGYPPFSRIVDVIMHDSNVARLGKLSKELVSRLHGCFGPMPCLGGPVQILGPSGAEDMMTARVIIKRDKSLAGRKAALAECIRTFENEKRYTGHVHIDVDPD